MKTTLLRSCLLVILSLNSLLIAQTQPVRKIIPENQNTEAPDEVRFNLDFPGGFAQELIAALGEASGTPVNAFIPEAADQFKMPRLKYHNVSVSEVLSALRYSEVVPVVQGTNYSSRTLSYRAIGYKWDLSLFIWPMSVEALVEMPDLPIEFQVKPFSIGDLLKTYTIDAITTTIDSAWKLNDAPRDNEMMFHPETKILLVKCSEHDMKVMEAVLQTLYSAIPIEETAVTSFRVSVLGAINKPGNYTFKPGTMITEVIAEAGGATRIGDIKKVQIKSKGRDQVVDKHNIAAILNGGEANFEIGDGDIITVPERVF